MVTREPKCVQWKRRGAEHVATQLSDLNPEQELEFWKEQTKQLKLLQAEAHKRNKQIGSA